MTINLGGHRDKALLLIAEPGDVTQGFALGAFGPCGEMIWPESGGEPGEWGWFGSTTTLYIAANESVSTANDDTPAAQYVPGRLRPFNFGGSLFAGVDPLARTRPSDGVIELEDPDGKLDYLLDYIWDGSRITLKRGTRGTAVSTWSTVGKFRSAGLLYDLATKDIRLRDGAWPLSGALHDEVYGGGGGLDGDPTISGRWKPWALGYVFSAEPVMINASLQIVQWSVGATDTLVVVRHGGVSLTSDGDYATYDDLAAATITSGRYATCLALSLARLNLTIEYGIRVDVIADGPTTRAGIAREIATTRGENRLDDATEIDDTSFDDMDADHPAPVGYYFSSSTSKADALDRVLGGILGWWRIRPDGKMSVGWVKEPDVADSALTLTWGDGRILEGLRMTAWAPPRAGTYVSWRTNHGPQEKSELASSVSTATANILREPARYAAALSSAVAALYPTAPKITVEGGFWEEADALVEASRQQDLMQVERRRWELTVFIDPFADVVGSVMTLAEVNRLGLGSEAAVLIVGSSTAGTPRVVLDLFG